MTDMVIKMPVSRQGSKSLGETGILYMVIRLGVHQNTRRTASPITAISPPKPQKMTVRKRSIPLSRSR